MGAELNSYNLLSAVSFLVHPLEKIGFSFLPNGTNDNKNFEAHFLDYFFRAPLDGTLSHQTRKAYHRLDKLFSAPFKNHIALTLSVVFWK